MDVEDGHVFGVKQAPDLCSVADLLHGRAPSHCIRAAMDGSGTLAQRERAILAAARRALKMLRFAKFDDLRSMLALKDPVFHCLMHLCPPFDCISITSTHFMYSFDIFII